MHHNNDNSNSDPRRDNESCFMLASCTAALLALSAWLFPSCSYCLMSTHFRLRTCVCRERKGKVTTALSPPGLSKLMLTLLLHYLLELLFCLMTMLRHLTNYLRYTPNSPCVRGAL